MGGLTTRLGVLSVCVYLFQVKLYYFPTAAGTALITIQCLRLKSGISASLCKVLYSALPTKCRRKTKVQWENNAQ